VLNRFRDQYLANLTEEIVHPGPQKGVLPGIRPLLDDLRLRPEVSIGLLTGNFEGGARIKLEHFDLWHFFSCGAFADDGPDRNSLFAYAVTRLEACGVADVRPSEVVIVGDTPLDVAVAVSAGARSVAVATGTYSHDALRETPADVVLEDLSDLSIALTALGVED
jgi:phosphoglycolate phosphatase-like HAD superfamily hydrolase